MKTINEDELAKILYTEHSLISEGQWKSTGDIRQDKIIDLVSQGFKVQLMNFGSFQARPRKGRLGVHPRTLQPLQIPDSITPKFLPSRRFKDSLKNKV